MWLNLKEMAERLKKTERAIQISIKRSIVSAKDSLYQYRYVEGIGRGGKNLEIWVDDEMQEPNEAQQPLKTPKRTSNIKRINALASDKKPTSDAPKMDRFLCLTKSEQKRVLERIELVKSYATREKWMTYEDWAQGKNDIPTKPHMLRLANLYKQGIKNHTLLNLFCDTRGRPRGSTKLTTEMQEMAQRYILRRDIHPNDVGIYELMKHAFKDTLPSCDTVCRYLKRWRDENRVLVAYAKDPDRARGKYRAALGNASEKAKYKNHFWELDGTPADIILSDGSRPTIIGAIDIYTRRVILTVEDKSNSYALARNLRAGILKLGIPENVVTDNGRDYKSNHFESVCQLLGINKQEVAPFSGWYKPHIERFFGTMTRELFRGLEGFCGHNVAERSAIRNSLSFEKKEEARKKWRQQKHTEKSFLRAMLDRDNTMPIFVPLTIEELRGWIEGWTNLYENRTHRGIDTTPLQKYLSCPMPANIIENERELDVLLGEWLERTVGKEGILMRRDGKEAQYTHPALIEYIGQKVYVALGADMGEITVYSDEMAPICTATDASLEGISRETMRNINREMRKVESESLKLTQRADELAKKLNDPTVKDIILAHTKVALKASRRVKTQKVELPNRDEILMNGDKPLFTTDFDALVWAIENAKEDEFAKLIAARAEIYELAKREIIYRRKAV
jgi:transposase InsO family protein